jgi:hypothetical protein
MILAPRRQKYKLFPLPAPYSRIRHYSNLYDYRR